MKLVFTEQEYLALSEATQSPITWVKGVGTQYAEKEAVACTVVQYDDCTVKHRHITFKELEQRAKHMHNGCRWRTEMGNCINPKRQLLICLPEPCQYHKEGVVHDDQAE